MKTRNFPAKKEARRLAAAERLSSGDGIRSTDYIDNPARSVRTKKDRRSLAAY